MKVNQLKAGALLSYLQMAMRLIIGLLYTPVMLQLLGKSEYGLYNTVSSTISMMSVLSLGFNSSYIRYYSQYKRNNDRAAIEKLNGLFLIIFLIIGGIALACGLFLSTHLELVFDQGLTAAEYATARILMILLTINLALSFPMSVFQSIISAHERFIVLKTLGMMKTVLSPFLTLPLLLMGYRSVAMVGVTLLIALVTDTVYLVYSKRVLKVRFCFRDLDIGVFKSLFAFTSFIAINIIVDQINSNMDKFLLARFQGTAAVAVYTVGYTLYQYYVMLSTAVSGVFTPRVHMIVNTTRESAAAQKQRLTELFIRVGRIQFLLLGLVASGLVLFGKPFIALWAGEGYEDAYYVALLLVLPASIALIQNVGIEIQRAQNNHKFRSVAYLIMALLNCVMTIFLCQRYGTVGAAVGTAVSLILANGILMNIYYHKRCNVDILAFWRSILHLARGMILPVILGGCMMTTIDFSRPFNLMLGILVYLVIYCGSMWLMGMNQYEKKLVSKPIQKLLKCNKR